MKRLPSFLAFCFAVTITIGAASQAAFACATSVYGANQSGDHVHCSLTRTTRDWCYYNCECHARSGGDCEDVYADLGLEAY